MHFAKDNETNSQSLKLKHAIANGFVQNVLIQEACDKMNYSTNPLKLLIPRQQNHLV